MVWWCGPPKWWDNHYIGMVNISVSHYRSDNEISGAVILLSVGFDSVGCETDSHGWMTIMKCKFEHLYLQLMSHM